MDKKRIEEIRKSLNIDDRLQFCYAEDLNLWIIGGYGPVDMQEELSKHLLEISDYDKFKESFRPYITMEDAIEGYNAYKFRMPFWPGSRDFLAEDIYFIQCKNNGTSYFACPNLNALRSFVLYA